MEMSRNERFPPGKILIQNLGLVYLGFCVGLAARSPGWTVGVTTVVHTVQVCTHTQKKTTSTSVALAGPDRCGQ